MIKYKYYGDSITESQALASGKFDKEFYVNNELKKIELYSDNSLNAIFYYMEAGEVEATVVNSFDSLGVIVDVIYKSLIGVYTERVLNEYDETGVLIAQTKELVTPNDESICTIFIWDIDGSNPINTVHKEFEIEILGGVEPLPALFAFDYNTDGSFKSCDLICEEDSFFKEKWVGNFDDIVNSGVLPIDWEYFRTDVFDPTGYELP